MSKCFNFCMNNSQITSNHCHGVNKKMAAYGHQQYTDVLSLEHLPFKFVAT